MNVKKIILMIASGLLLASAFLNLPYISTIYFRGTILICLLIYNFINPFLVEKELNQNEPIKIIEDIPVYKVPYNFLKSHNVMIFKGKSYNILVEKEVLDALDEEELTAVLYHEIGHTHTIQASSIFVIETIAFFFNSQGLNEIIYHNSGKILLLIGVSLFILSEVLKRHVEYKADEYAINNGCSKEKLISAISIMEKMNGKKNRIVLSGHPSTKKRSSKGNRRF